MSKILGLQALTANAETNLHAASALSVSCKDSSHASLFSANIMLFKKEVRTMRKILNLQALVADEEVDLHAASNRSVQCKTSSYKSWFAC